MLNLEKNERYINKINCRTYNLSNRIRTLIESIVY